MRMYDIIRKKRDKGALSDEEIQYFVEGYTRGEIPDYQASALLMAIYFQGMDGHETAWLTDCMARSGEQIDLSSIPGIKVDKHSTGGVGDKTTMVIGPVVAALGVPVAKLSGRGLGHTGGTLDKLESIPGLTTALDRERFFDMVKEIGIAVAGQTGDLAPADKKLYALRDVTATVDHISLIAASIMSKKIASGSDRILLDVKTGSGAFMKTLDDSIALGKEMVGIGEKVGREVVALVTDMDRPLGRNIGNALEVIEAVDTLKGHGPEDFTQLCLALSSNMLYLAKKGTMAECAAMAQEALESGRAFKKFCQMAGAQGGDISYLKNPAKFTISPVKYELKAEKSGYIMSMDTEKCGMAAVELGAGRRRKEDSIDYGAGIVLKAAIGDRMEAGETIAVLYTSDPGLQEGAVSLLREAIVTGPEQPGEEKLIYARVTKDGVEWY